MSKLIGYFPGQVNPFCFEKGDDLSHNGLKNFWLGSVSASLFADRAYYQGNDHAPNLDGDTKNILTTNHLLGTTTPPRICHRQDSTQTVYQLCRRLYYFGQHANTESRQDSEMAPSSWRCRGTMMTAWGSLFERVVTEAI